MNIFVPRDDLFDCARELNLGAKTRQTVFLSSDTRHHGCCLSGEDKV